MKRILTLLAMAMVLLVPVRAELSLTADIYDISGDGYQTADSGVAIAVNIQPNGKKRVVIIGGSATVDTPASNWYFMYPNQLTTLSSAITAGDSLFYTTDSLTDAGGAAIAANDYLAVQCNDGLYYFVTCSVYTAGKQVDVKISEKFTSAAAAGRKVFYFGAPGDGDEYLVPLTKKTTTTLPVCTIVGPTRGYPMKAVLKNLTAAGATEEKINSISWGYVDQ